MRAKQESRWLRAEDIVTVATAVALMTFVTLLTILRWPDFAPSLEKYSGQGAIDRAAVAFVEHKMPVRRHETASEK